MVHIATLSHDEPVRLDSEQLAVLFRRLGPVAAEGVVARAMEEITLRISELAPLADARRLADLAHRAQRLVAIAEQIGLVAFSRVAADVAGCAERGDPAALGATMARLERLYERSVLALWDLQDMGP